MSWSFNAVGTRRAVLAKALAWKPTDGGSQGEAAKQMIVGQLKQFPLYTSETGVRVDASGHSATEKVGQLRIEIQNITLEPEPEMEEANLRAEDPALA